MNNFYYHIYSKFERNVDDFTIFAKSKEQLHYTSTHVPVNKITSGKGGHLSLRCAYQGKRTLLTRTAGLEC